MTKGMVSNTTPGTEPANLLLTPAETYHSVCEALRTEAFPGFEVFSNAMTARGRVVSWRSEFENEAYPSVRIVVADRDGQILDTSLVVDLRHGEPQLFWLVAPRGQARHSYTEAVPGGLSGLTTTTVVRELTLLYTAALVG